MISYAPVVRQTVFPTSFGRAIGRLVVTGILIFSNHYQVSWHIHKSLTSGAFQTHTWYLTFVTNKPADHQTNQTRTRPFQVPLTCNQADSSLSYQPLPCQHTHTETPRMAGWLLSWAFVPPTKTVPATCHTPRPSSRGCGFLHLISALLLGTGNDTHQSLHTLDPSDEPHLSPM